MLRREPVWNDHAARLVHKTVRGAKGVLTFEAPTLAPHLEPGQFVNLEVPGHVLRRPMAPASGGGRTFEVVMTARREGTRDLLNLPLGAEVRVLGPLGNTFPPPTGRAVLISGGSGAGPLAYLANRLAATGHEVVVLHGARDASEAHLVPLFAREGARVHYFSEDGSYGEAGLPTQALPELLAAGPATVYAVGPEGLMRAAARLAAEHGAPCYVSLEAHMACGVGACLSCVHPTTRGTVHLCVDGPIFNAEEVIWGDEPTQH